MLFYSSNEHAHSFLQGLSLFPFFSFFVGLVLHPPCQCVLPLFIWERKGLSVFFLIKWWLCQSSLLYLCNGFYLSSIAWSLSEMSQRLRQHVNNLLLVTQTGMICKLRSLFIQIKDLGNMRIIFHFSPKQEWYAGLGCSLLKSKT